MIPMSKDRASAERPATIRDAAFWRWRFVVRPILRRWAGVKDIQWARVVLDRQTQSFVRALPFRTLDVAEISAQPGNAWSRFGFRSYVSTMFPAFDICAAPLGSRAFDIVIAEQVLEHVDRPWAAVRNVYEMLRPGGWFIVSTPFLLRVHAYPNDFSRWTEGGLKELLAQGGFRASQIVTASWGNRPCVRANLRGFPAWIPWWHSLRNEPDYPVVVWAFAQREVEDV
jgi:SAM-dependent methyltransferase